MVKTALIVVLILALCGAALLTKPKKADFDTYYRVQQPALHGGFISDLLARAAVEDYLKKAELKDHVLWVTIEKDGQTQYTGAFNHWFTKAPPPVTAPAPR